MLTLKDNQPTLHALVKSLLWVNVPTVDTTIDNARGRVAIHKLQVATPRDRGLSDWPGLVQIGRLIRERTISGVNRTEVVYLLTSLPQLLAGPAFIADTMCGH